MTPPRNDASEETTIAAALQRATHALGNSGCAEPRLDAELLLAYALQADRRHLHAHGDAHLTPAQQAAFAALVQRRAAREPLAYIIGHREFYGRDYDVDRRVLIPRPETEQLVELALAHMRSLPAGPCHVADIGTGSGIIAITLALEWPQAIVYGLDISADALAVAAINSARLGTEERVVLRCGDLLAPLERRVHCIIANLPYVAAGEWAELSPEIRLYEPEIALAGGPDGLDLIRRLLSQASDYLLPGGAILLEIGAQQGPAALALATRAFPHASTRLHRDFSELDRVLTVHLAPTHA